MTERQIKDEDDKKGETARVGGRQTRQGVRWEESLGTFQRLFPQPQTKAKA